MVPSLTTDPISSETDYRSANPQAVDSIPVSFLRRGDSPRSMGEDQDHIRRLAESGSSRLPPILVHRTTMRVIDGMHRLSAVMLNGCDRIDVEYFDGSEEEAFCRAVELNVSHGLPLSLADRKSAAARILAWRPGLSDRATAAITGLSPKTVGAIRTRASEEIPQTHERLGSDGRRRPVNGIEGRRRAAKAITERPDASLREIAATAGISPGTARRVRKQLATHKDVAEGLKPKDIARRRNGQLTVSGKEAPIVTPNGLNRHIEVSHDAKSVLRKLCNDPSLKYSESGRALLRWLHIHIMDEDDLNQASRATPLHSAPVIARLARYNARLWEKLASELERASRLNAMLEQCLRGSRRLGR